MAELRLEEEQAYAHPSEKPTGFPARLVAWGIARDERQARVILLGIAIVALAVAFIVPFFSGAPQPRALPPGSTIVNIPGQPPRLLTPEP